MHEARAQQENRLHCAVLLLILTNEIKFTVGSFLPKLNMEIIASHSIVILSHPCVSVVRTFLPFVFSTLQFYECCVGLDILPFH